MRDSATDTRNILVIEDDPSYGRMISRGLQRENFSVQLAASGKEGLFLAQERSFDLILLDIYLCDSDGIKIHRTLRQRQQTKDTPIILMTGLSILNSLLESACIGLNAEPIFLKTNGFQPLLQRIQRSLASHHPTLRKGPVCINMKTREIWVHGKKLPALPTKRFDLFCTLVQSEGTINREKILQETWASQSDPKIVDITIARLRKDLKETQGVFIETTRYGYKLTFAPIL